jgi:hypothetical protein
VCIGRHRRQTPVLYMYCKDKFVLLMDFDLVGINLDSCCCCEITEYIGLICVMEQKQPSSPFAVCSTNRSVLAF